MDTPAESSPVVTVDCQYIQRGRASAYLLVDGDQAAFVDNNTPRAVPLLLDALEARGLRPEQVAYAIVTHVHLDHAAGTAALLGHCPNAHVIAHPRASRHLADPARLVASAKQVYGDAVFEKLYGTIAPVDASRIRTVEDGETMQLGARTLEFLHTPGHANHHICVYDAGSRGVFTGDAFGVTPPAPDPTAQRVMLFSCPPTSFRPDEARTSLRRLLATGAERAYLAHFGEVTHLDAAAEQLRRFVDAFETILNDAAASDERGPALEAFCEAQIRNAMTRESKNRPVPLNDQDWEWFAADIRMNAQGIAYLAEKQAMQRG
ncbi:MAG TPA: MBL fold metallo-hydrolase [Candidatus Hydrogenedentes bacterium]|nr:MBL fold metallo-hydrolase [Candidatus Hydrogenedentota bacterium]HIJ74899.1 MBL fold metallo-hydrolase [Candidatus Hydrogenedentota bacterium]